MKKKIYISYALSFLLLLGACEQDIPELKDPCDVYPESCAPDTSCEDAEAGSANFTKFIAIGNSFVAGVQGGALFTAGQDNSLPAIMNKQFECAGAPATFNQPSINATLGWNLFVTQPFLTNPTKPILGRMLLQYGTTPDCATGAVSPRPTPQAYAVGVLEALPNPTFNTGFMYTSSKTALNNFAVPAITIGQALTPATGNWADPDPAKGFTPFYARFASAPGTSAILSDANAAGGTFALVWLGLDDFFLHAAFGADPTKAPLTDATTFGTYFGAVFGHPMLGLWTNNPNLKVVVGNFPNIFAMPHFTSVKYNPIPLDAATATAVSTGFAGYNAALDGLIANAGAFGISDELKAEIGTRKVSFTASCTNKILIIDETLTDLGPYFDGLQSNGAISADQRTALIPYEQVRQTTSADIIPLSTGSVLGTLVDSNPTLVNGVTVPLGDQYALIPSEIEAIEAARTAYNTAIQTFVSGKANIALADINAALNTLITNQVAIYNGVAITPNINPPTGIYSEDGVHPNTRGYAFLSRVFIQAINDKFGSTIPLTDLSLYQATGLPIE